MMIFSHYLQRKKRKIPKVTDGLESVIEDKYINHCAPAIEIYKVLKNNYGYKGSYSTIKRFTHSLKNKKVNEVTIHFETAPGKQCQIDWKERLRLINKYGEVFTVDIFLAILGYSRLKFIKLTTDKTQKTLFRCLGELFRYLDGVPKELLFDNMRTVVDRSRTQFDEPIYNDKLVSFSKDAGFIPKSCVAFRPRTKGKVETLARIVNRLKAYNNEFETFEDLERIVDKLKEEGIIPGIVVILVGDDPASVIYTRNKQKNAEKLGVKSILRKFPKDVSQAEVLQAIHHYNDDPTIHAILIQLPLPKHLNQTELIEAIAPEKDVDGFNGCIIFPVDEYL